MILYSSYLLLFAVLFPYSMSLSVGKLGIAVDLNIKMFHSSSNFPIQGILSQAGGSGSFTVLRERLDKADKAWADHDKTGLSILLSYSCSHAKCTEVKNSQKCGALVGEVGNPTTSEYLMKLVLRRTNVVDGEWQLDCRKFLKVEIPEKDDGVPGARTVSGTERLGTGRTPSTSSALGEKNVGSGNKVEFDVDSVEAPPPVFKDEEEEPVTGSTSSVPSNDELCTNTLFNHETQKFYDECCRKRSAEETDKRCDMEVIMAKLQALKDATSTTTTTTSTTTKSPVDASDLERSGKSFDLDDENNTMVYNKEAADVLFQEMSGELSGWKSKYYTCLGFFLVFFAFFLVTIAVLVYKVKKNKTVSPPASPGASLSVPQQRPRGYSAIEGDTETERAPLTPATEQAQAFQY